MAQSELILADTSVWIDYLRGASSRAILEFDQRLDDHAVMICGPVAAELLTGMQAKQRMRMWETFAALPWLDVDRAHWFTAGDVRARLRERGVQVSLPDVLIAAAASGRATLWTRDRHFEPIAELLESLELKLLDD
jgi:predicted nucleic acid-binding protein